MTPADRTSHFDERGSKLIIVAGPQGVGKTYLANELCKRSQKYAIAPGVVTRLARDEQDGNDVQVTAPVFRQMSERGELCLEAVVGGEQYGYIKKGIQSALTNGQQVIMLLLNAADVSEALRLWPEATRIFLRPSDWELIRERLRDRRSNSDSDAERGVRLGKEVIAQLDTLQWDLRIPVDRNADQVAVVSAFLANPT